MPRQAKIPGLEQRGMPGGGAPWALGTAGAVGYAGFVMALFAPHQHRLHRLPLLLLLPPPPPPPPPPLPPPLPSCGSSFTVHTAAASLSRWPLPQAAASAPAPPPTPPPLLRQLRQRALLLLPDLLERLWWALSECTPGVCSIFTTLDCGPLASFHFGVGVTRSGGN